MDPRTRLLEERHRLEAAALSAAGGLAAGREGEATSEPSTDDQHPADAGTETFHRSAARPAGPPAEASWSAADGGPEPSHDAGEYGTHIAGDYDAIYGEAFDTDGAVECLASLAAGGPVLEFGVGTGRVAIPLSRRGLEVHGIDGSAEMLALLASKPGGDAVQTMVGDFAATSVAESFSLIVLLVNTVYALPDQEAQLRCFANAAKHLRPGGRFVVEAWIPDPPRPGEVRVRPRALSPGYSGLVIEQADPVAQVLTTTQLVFSDGRPVRVFPVVHRYAWPTELDLMARLSGLNLEYRWADWERRPFGEDSRNHVSVWRRGP